MFMASSYNSYSEEITYVYLENSCFSVGVIYTTII